MDRVSKFKRESGIVNWSIKSGAQDTAEAILSSSFERYCPPDLYVPYKFEQKQIRKDVRAELQDDATQNTTQMSDFQHDSIDNSRRLSCAAVSDPLPAATPSRSEAPCVDRLTQVASEASDPNEFVSTNFSHGPSRSDANANDVTLPSPFTPAPTSKRISDAVIIEAQDGVTPKRQRVQVYPWPGDDRPSASIASEADSITETDPPPQYAEPTPRLQHQTPNHSLQSQCRGESSPLAPLSMLNGEEHSAFNRLVEAATEALDSTGRVAPSMSTEETRGGHLVAGVELDFTHLHNPRPWPDVDAGAELDFTHLHNPRPWPDVDAGAELDFPHLHNLCPWPDVDASAELDFPHLHNLRPWPDVDAGAELTHFYGPP